MTRRATLGGTRWPELSDRSVTLLVPLGATEQHGPHLPLDTDTRIAAEVASRAAVRLADEHRGHTDLILAAPALNYGASGEHEGFPGTVSLGHEALHLLLLEYGRSACRWADRIVFVNGHGGNGRSLVTAVRQLRYEAREVAWFPCAFAEGDAHAGLTETSVLLDISPDDVLFDVAVAGNVAPVATLLPAMREGGVAAVSANGVLGDPSGASRARGAELVDLLVDGLAEAVGSWSVGEMGRVG